MSRNIIPFNAQNALKTVNVNKVSVGKNVINTSLLNSNFTTQKENSSVNDRNISLNLDGNSLKEYTFEELLKEVNTTRNNLNVSNTRENTKSSTNSELTVTVTHEPTEPEQHEDPKRFNFVKNVYENFNAFPQLTLEETLKILNKKSISLLMDETDFSDCDYEIKCYGNKYIFEDGQCVRIEYNSGLIVNIDYKDNGDIKKIDYNQDFYMFQEKFLKEYGGDQMTFMDNSDKLLSDPLILFYLKLHFPHRTLEEYELYLEQIANTGCGYVAMVNSLFMEFQGREEEFEKKFGIPMYYATGDGRIKYNYEYFILASFTYIIKEQGEYTFDEIIDGVKTNTSDNIITGSGYETVQLFEKFLKERYGIKSDFKWVIPYQKDLSRTDSEDFSEKNKAIELIKQKAKNGEQFAITTEEYDLYYFDEVLGRNVKKTSEGGHVMYVTGITENDELIVSTWGEKYILDLTFSKEIGYYEIDYK